MKKIILRILLINVIVLFIVICILNKNRPSIEEECWNAYALLKDKELDGIITAIGQDSLEHFFKAIFYLNNEGMENSFLLEYDLSGLYEFAKKGDKIQKKDGEYEVYLHRDCMDTIFILDYGCARYTGK